MVCSKGQGDRNRATLEKNSTTFCPVSPQQNKHEKIFALTALYLHYETEQMTRSKMCHHVQKKRNFTRQLLPTLGNTQFLSAFEQMQSLKQQ